MSLVPEHIKNLSPYIAGKTIDSVRKEYGLSRIIKLASNENPSGPSKKSVAAASKSLNNNHRYPDSSGYLLRQMLADKFNLNLNNVIVGSGSEGIMSTIVRTFLKDNDEIISAENSFIGFRVLANASGKKIHWVPMKNYHYNLSEILKSVNNKTKIIYLANPDNPTGTYFTISEFDIFMKAIPDRVLVILDEAYFEYAQFIKDYPDSMLYRYDNVITLRTFSKAYGLAGFRVGYGFAHSDLIKNLMKVKLPFEPSMPAQEAAIAAIQDEKHINDSININKTGYKYITTQFRKMNIKYIESVTNFITIIFENSNSADKCYNFLLSQGVIVRYLIGFGLPLCIRVTIGTEEENLIFINTIKIFIKE